MELYMSEEIVKNESNENTASVNFIHAAIDLDNENNVYKKRVHTRFPPEPNGYLHIGHAKAICVNFTTAEKYGGKCNLRFDDTNPAKEDTEYVDSIKADIKWLGFNWDNLLFASDYFELMYEIAEKLIKNGDAYVCDLTLDQMREYRGTLTTPGKDSPFRNRTVEENLDLFRRMKNGEFETGLRVLRAKIDMASPNMNMRDPALYRIVYSSHHKTGDKWCIYPMYDYAHPLEDGIENITHSLCSIEFEDHRPLYDWVVRKAGFAEPPRQIEFSRLEITDTVMSKRLLRVLVENNTVDGWDDPRMPTLCGLRRRGYTPESIRDFCEKIGIAKANSCVDVGFLEYCVKEDLKLKKPRAMAVIDPIKCIITNYTGEPEKVSFPNNPENPELGSREMTFGREIYIEREDFMDPPPPKYHRMYPGNEVRLMGAYIVKCIGCKKDDMGNVVEVYCEYIKDTKSGESEAGRKVKGTIHWVFAGNAVPIEFSLVDSLYKTQGDEQILNCDSLIIKNGYGEACLKEAKGSDTYQFLRIGYFCRDTKKPDKLSFIRTVSMKSSFKLPQV
jgi:glutaminyl-tRNA synthetase